MPLYEFRCKDCWTLFQFRRKISEMENPCTEICPNCGSGNTYQYFDGLAFTLKGEGFHKNDYPKHVNLRPGEKD